MKIRNLTPHSINLLLIQNGNYVELVYKPENVAARISENNVHVGGFIPTGMFKRQKFGDVTHLPELENGTLILVSNVLRTFLPDRPDLIGVGETKRDPEGRITGCYNFLVNDGFEEFVTESGGW